MLFLPVISPSCPPAAPAVLELSPRGAKASLYAPTRATEDPAAEDARAAATPAHVESAVVVTLASEAAAPAPGSLVRTSRHLSVPEMPIQG